MEDKITVFVDSVGRMIIGEQVGSTQKKLRVKNPTVVNINPDPQTNQLSVQLIPFVFTEFLHEDKRSETVWSFSKDSIVEPEDIKLDSRVLEQYKGVVSGVPNLPAPHPGAQSKSDPEVIQLFDDE